MKKLSSIILIVLIIIIISTIYTNANDNNKLIIFLINRISLEDLEEMSFLSTLIADGDIGLMNTRGFGHSNDFSSMVTMGSGTRSDATYYTTRSYNLNIENSATLKRRIGFLKKNAQIANIDIARLKNLNQDNDYNPHLGALGNSLNRKNIETAVIGNSDIIDRKYRFGPLLVMNQNGQVDYGNIEDNTIMMENSYAYGIKTNYSYIFNRFMEFEKTSDCILLELGDLYRLDRYRFNIDEGMYEVHKKRVLEDIDTFVKEIYSNLNLSTSEILIISPYPSSISYEEGRRLSPVIRYNINNEQGVLTSPTTKRTGIIGNVDIAPYISNYFNGNLDKYTGRLFYSIPQKNNYEYIKNLHEDVSYVYSNRGNVLYTFAIYYIIILILAFGVIQIKKINDIRLLKLIEFLLLSTLTIPLVLLILPLFRINNLFYEFIIIIIQSLVLTLFVIKIRRNPIDSIILLSGLICIVLSIDIINDSYLIKRSFLGFDPIIGARYYGIGNEFMGILVGSSLVFITALLDKIKFNKIFMIVFLVGITLIIGFPTLGANVGGMITAVFAFMFAILKLLYNRLKIRHYIYIVASIALLIGVVSLIDVFILQNKSHLANSINQISNDGGNIIFSIIRRKITMNIKLFNVTIWSKVLLLTIILLGILFYRPFGIIKQIFIKYNNLSIGLLGILMACVVGFIVNDSGVVAAATAMILLGMSLMYLVLEEIKEKYDLER